MDGTLLETEHYWGEALQALARRLHGEMSDAGRQATVGASMRTSMRVLDADLSLRRTEEQRATDGRWVEDTTARLTLLDSVVDLGVADPAGLVAADDMHCSAA